MKNSWAAQAAYFLLRVVAGFMLFQTGSAILFGMFGGMHGMPPALPHAIFTEMGMGGALQFLGGIAIVLGLYARPAAFVVSGMMAVAYWQFHAPHGHWPFQNEGMPAVLLCFIYLYIAAQGAGSWSLDAKARGKA